MNKIMLLFIAGTLLSGPIQARQEPERSSADGRIRYVEYNDGDIVHLNSAMRQSTLVTFAPGEVLLEVSPGDPNAWIIKPNAERTRLYLRPKATDGHTNLNLFTNQGRAYTFELSIAKKRSAAREDRAWRLHFTYPELDAQRALVEYEAEHAAELFDRVPSSEWNLDYSVSGDAGITPRHVFDDGRHTYFEFAEHAPAPAIFAVDTNGDESLVNWHLDPSGRYVVVEAIKQQFTLRSGKLVVCLWNDRIYTAPATATAPQAVATFNGVEDSQNDSW